VGVLERKRVCRMSKDIVLRVRWNPLTYRNLLWCGYVLPSLPSQKIVFQIAALLVPVVAFLLLLLGELPSFFEIVWSHIITPDATSMYGGVLTARLTEWWGHVVQNSLDNWALGAFMAFAMWGVLFFVYAKLLVEKIYALGMPEHVREFKTLVSYDSLKAGQAMTFSTSGIQIIEAPASACDKQEIALRWEHVLQIDLFKAHVVFYAEPPEGLYVFVVPLCVVPNMADLTDLLRQYAPKAMRDGLIHANEGVRLHVLLAQHRHQQDLPQSVSA
jgi:hypothetical protein